MKRTRIVFALILIATTALAAVGLQSSSSPAANTAFFNSFASLRTYIGRSDRTTYTCSAGGLATTSAYALAIEAEVARGFHISRICVGTSAATAAALQTLTVRRTTTASSGGTIVTAEGTGTSGVAQLVPGSGNWSGVCRLTGTAGTAGALMDIHGWTVGEIAAGTADPGTTATNCFEYGLNGSQMPYVASGVANGVDVRVTAAGAGGLASGSISITFIAE
jgi:hypothetical protein